MSYQDDPNGNLRRSEKPTEESSYTGWLIGGAVALAVILGVFMMSSRTDNSGMATNDSPTTSRPATPPATPPTTTGSGSSQPSNSPASVPTTPDSR